MDRGTREHRAILDFPFQRNILECSSLSRCNFSSVVHVLASWLCRWCRKILALAAQALVLWYFCFYQEARCHHYRCHSTSEHLYLLKDMCTLLLLATTCERSEQFMNENVAHTFHARFYQWTTFFSNQHISVYARERKCDRETSALSDRIALTLIAFGSR